MTTADSTAMVKRSIIRLRKLLVFVVAVVLWLSTTASPALGFGLLGGSLRPSYLGGPTRTFCFDSSYPFPYDSMKNTIRQGIHLWDDINQTYFDWAEVSPGSGCQLWVRYQSLGTDHDPAETHFQNPMLDSSGYIRTPVYLEFNKSRGSQTYWYGAWDSYCITQAPDGTPSLPAGYHKCLFDAQTIATHESGHALGLAHNITPDRYYTLCRAGGHDWDVMNYCDVAPTNLDGYAKNVMYWQSADGYRRTPLSDDIGGIQRIYGICCS